MQAQQMLLTTEPFLQPHKSYFDSPGTFMVLEMYLLIIAQAFENDVTDILINVVVKSIWKKTQNVYKSFCTTLVEIQTTNSENQSKLEKFTDWWA